MIAIRKHLGDFVALTILILISIGVGGYILANQESRPKIPFVEEKPFKVNIVLSDAQAAIPGQGQSIRVAGVKVGLIGEVKLEEGQAVVVAELDRKYLKDLDLHSDTTALLRPRTGLKDMFIEIEPGAPRREDRGERQDPGAEHRAGRRPGRVPLRRSTRTRAPTCSS